MAWFAWRRACLDHKVPSTHHSPAEIAFSSVAVRIFLAASSVLMRAIKRSWDLHLVQTNRFRYPPYRRSKKACMSSSLAPMKARPTCAARRAKGGPELASFSSNIFACFASSPGLPGSAREA